MQRFHFGLLCAIIFFAGCVDTRNPIVIVRSAGNAVLENNLKNFQATLSKNILSDLGTQAKLDELKSKLLAHKKMDVSNAVLMHSEQGEQGHGYWGDILRLSDVNLIDQISGENILQIEVTCKVWVDRIEINSGACNPQHPNCSPQYQYVENQDCRISKIEP